MNENVNRWVYILWRLCDTVANVSGQKTEPTMKQKEMKRNERY